MNSVYGNIIVEIENPVITDKILNINLYNGLFVHVKGKYYTPAHSLFEDNDFIELAKLFSKHHNGGLCFTSVFSEVFHNLHKQYHEREFFRTVKVVHVTPSNPVLSGVYLKALNLLDNSRYIEEVKKLFNKPYSSDEAVKFLDTMTKTYLTESIVYGLPSNKNRWKAIYDQETLTLLMMAVEYLKTSDDKHINLNKLNNKLIAKLLNQTIIYQYPVYKTVIRGVHGITCMFGVNDHVTTLFQPTFSSRVIKLTRPFKPKYQATIVESTEYYEEHKPVKSKGIKTQTIKNKYPILSHNPEERVFYVLAVSRKNDDNVIVRIPEEDIITEGNKVLVNVGSQLVPLIGVNAKYLNEKRCGIFNPHL